VFFENFLFQPLLQKFRSFYQNTGAFFEKFNHFFVFFLENFFLDLTVLLIKFKLDLELSYTFIKLVFQSLYDFIQILDLSFKKHLFIGRLVIGILILN